MKHRHPCEVLPEDTITASLAHRVTDTTILLQTSLITLDSQMLLIADQQFQTAIYVQKMGRFRGI